MKAKILLLAAATILAGCATQLSDSERQLRAERMFKEGFSKGNKEMAARVHEEIARRTASDRDRRKTPRRRFRAGEA